MQVFFIILTPRVIIQLINDLKIRKNTTFTA